MIEFTPDQFNALFGEAIKAGGETMEKLGQATGLFVQHKLRENAFCRKIMTPETVTERECQRSLTEDSLEYVDDIEPDSVAMRINWRGEPDKTWIMGKRYSIRFHTISSDTFQKTESELRAYRMPLTKVIEQNIVRDIQEAEDLSFMDHVKAALFLATRHQYNKLVERGVYSTTKNFADETELANFLFTQNKIYQASPWAAAIPTSALNRARGYHTNVLFSDQTEFNRIVLREVVKVCAARQMKAKCFLMHEYDYADTVAWSVNEAGLEVTSEIVKDGYKYTTIGGFTYVTTVRDNPKLVMPGQIFCFPSPQFLGRFLILDNTKFFIDRRGRFISMEAWEEIGAGFGNILGVACVLLKGAELTIPVQFQDPLDALTGAGSLRIINDHTRTSIPVPV
jgi:hypothetical protein